MYVKVSLDKEASDSKLAKKHLANLQDIKIEDFVANGAYYEQELYQILKKREVQPIIKMPKNAVNNGLDPMHSAVREMHELGGYKLWRDKLKYGHR